MVHFIDVSYYYEKIIQYIIVDEDMLYRWRVEDTTKPIQTWLCNRNEYKFRLEYNADFSEASIAVYHANVCLLREKVEDVQYL